VRDWVSKAVLHGRVVVITGASAGIGRATALHVAQLGADVVLVARRRERLGELITQISEQANGRALAIPCDLAEAGAGQKIIAQTVAHFGRVDVLLNNAGLGHHSLLTELSGEELNQMLRVNVLAVFELAQAAAQQMLRQEVVNGRRGYLINVSSIVSGRPLRHAAGYTASKAAVDHLTRGFWLDLQGKGVAVTAVYPGVTRTEFNRVRLGKVGESQFSGFAVAPERVAQKIGRVMCMKRPWREVYITPVDWLFVQLNRLFPRVLDRVFARVQT